MATTNQDFAKTHLVSLTNFGFSQKKHWHSVGKKSIPGSKQVNCHQLTPLAYFFQFVQPQKNIRDSSKIPIKWKGQFNLFAPAFLCSTTSKYRTQTIYLSPQDERKHFRLSGSRVLGLRLLGFQGLQYSRGSGFYQSNASSTQGFEHVEGYAESVVGTRGLCMCLQKTCSKSVLSFSPHKNEVLSS